MALIVKPDSPFRSLGDLQAAARARPGRVTYGTLGVTSIPHLAMVQWRRRRASRSSTCPTAPMRR
jgi:tripartite-type tricarboxylate transporter receptor subunit TctC